MRSSLEATGRRLEVYDAAASAATVFSSTNPWPLTPDPSSARRGISLLEVLFAMGILLIGLLGVGAMIPAGRFEVLQGAKIDHASMIGRQAFRDLKVRGYLNPANWNVLTASTTLTAAYTTANGFNNVPSFANTTNYNNTNFNLNKLTPGIVIDPLGVANSMTNTFPIGASPLYLTRVVPFGLTSVTALNIGYAADPVFRSGDDLLFSPNTGGKDFPPTQSCFFVDASSNVKVHALPAQSGETTLKRASDGNYSWIATVVTDPRSSALLNKLTVSVVIFYKRDLVSPTAETTVSVANLFSRSGNVAIGGGEVELTNPTNLVKPGQWIMLAGTVVAQLPDNSTPPQLQNYNLYYFSWYRVVAAADRNPSTNNQNVTLQGPDWLPTAANTTAWLFDNVIAVFEKNLKLEIQ